MSEYADPREESRREDDALVRRAQAGRRDAFRSLYQKYQERVFATACRIVGDRTLSADLTQEIFVKIYEELPGFRFESSFSTWLYRVAANHAINKANETGRRARIREEAAREFASASAGRSGTRDRFADERVQDALAELSVKLRAAVVLRYLEGLSYGEIAEALDLSVGTVKSRLFLAHAALKTLLEDVLKDDRR